MARNTTKKPSKDVQKPVIVDHADLIEENKHSKGTKPGTFADGSRK
jgi:hypothetical protein